MLLPLESILHTLFLIVPQFADWYQYGQWELTVEEKRLDWVGEETPPEDEDEYEEDYDEEEEEDV